MNSPKPRNRTPKGFALVIAVTLMVLLTIIAVGFLGLSTVTLRASTAMEATSVARANARMALVQAIAQLQLYTGPDTRVTATADMLDPSNAPVTGVWRSWEGKDRDNKGKPIAPDYEQKKKSGEPNEVPNKTNEGRFLGWLTSLPNSNAGTELPKEISSTPGTGFVQLVAEGSTDDIKRRIYIQPTMIDSGKGGAMAWWTSGENAKAMINTPPVAAVEPKTAADWQQHIKSNGRADAKQFSLEKVYELEKAVTVPSTGSLQLLATAQKPKKIHDLTSYSKGLQVNVACGGWKKDLSIFSERFNNYSSTGLPTYTWKPGETPVLSKKASTSTPDNTELLYPKTWGAAYRNGGRGSGWQQVPPVCSWSTLADYMLQYTKLDSSSSISRTSMSTDVGTLYGESERYKFQDQIRRCPQIARMHWIYSLCSKKVASTDPKAPATYKPGLLITPVLTLWNPYNVRLTVNSFYVNIQQTAPLRFTFKVGEQPYTASLYEATRMKDESSQEYQSFKLNIASSITLDPGASRVFSVTDPKPLENIDTAAGIPLKPGYKPNGGVLFYGLNKGKAVAAVEASTSFKVTKISYDAKTIEGGKAGIGIIYDIGVDGASGKAAHRMIYDVNELGGSGVIDKLYPPLDSTKFPTGMTVGNVEDLKNRPFASAIFAYRMASPASTDRIRHKHLFSKGMLQSNPLCYYTEIGFGDDFNAITSMTGTGVYHPVNAPYDFAFQEVDGWNDSMSIPQYDLKTNSSYIVSGLTAGEGVTRCIMAELPTRPLQSLAELQHFDARNNNPIPPFQFNLIGNGSANPIFSPDQVSVKTGYNNGMCNDDTYLLNHVLFDDWFVSSIAVDLKDFTRTTERAITKVYEDYLSGTTSLPNRFYTPTANAAIPDIKVAATEITKSSKNSQTGMFTYETIASKLEVLGMFNVNSVSLDAWKALLKQGRGAQVPYLKANGATSLDQETNHPFPRTSIAGDTAADSGSSDSNPSFPEASQFVGYRTLTDEQIDALADEVVKEIRLRGPFLSLSEFVNRRLSTDKDLAIASTIQKALDRLSTMGGSSPKNPFSALQKDPAVSITAMPAGNTDYKFPEAGLGWSSFGTPGWVRQADILKPLAPMITVRDDTFTIRAYGDARDKADPTKIVSKAWCEVVIQRQANYVDSSIDDAAIQPYTNKIKSTTNNRFGRKYELISFRWLSEREV